MNEKQLKAYVKMRDKQRKEANKKAKQLLAIKPQQLLINLFKLGVK